MLLSSQHSTLVSRSSASKIDETGVGKPVSKLPSLGSGQTFTLLATSSMYSWCFLLKCCNGFSLKPARPMCDGRLFAAWWVEAPFFRGFHFRWVLHVVLSLTRSVIVHDATPCSKEDSLYDCGRPCDALSCLFFSAPWLQQSQSFLVQEIQSAKNIDLPFSRRSRSKPPHAFK